MHVRPVVSCLISCLAACLVLSCSVDSPTEPARPSATPPSSSAPSTTAPEASRTASPTAPESPDALPAVPSERPKALARELDRAVATLRDPRSTPDEVRRAGEYHQLAVHRLAHDSPAFSRDVLARAGRQAATVVRADVQAARSLIRLTDPQPRLPEWRIIAPPPPQKLRGFYAEAQRRTGVPWTYLAAIHLVETRMGRIRGTSTAGAQGPMQFIPSTWDIYGDGGDVNDPRDAILAAARLLEANGAPDDMPEALYHYNPSDRYVEAITAHARTMQRTAYVYRSYWHWRVLYRHVRGVHVLPEGYPRVRAVLLDHR